MSVFNVGDVVAYFKADLTGFKQGIETAKTGMQKMSSDMVSSSQSLAKGLGVLAVGAGVAGIAIGRDLVRSASDAQVQMAKVDALLKTTSSFDKNKQAVNELSKAYIKLGFDDEETSLAMAKSLAVTDDVTESQKEMAVASDFARLKGIGIVEAQTALQKAYMGNKILLKQYGIEISDTATKEEIFTAVQKVSAGQAIAYADTYAGKLEAMTVAFTNVKEEAGARLLPILTKLMDWVMVTAVPALQQFAKWVTENKDLLIALAIGITAMLIPAFIAWGIAMIPVIAGVIATTAPLLALGAVVTAVAYLIVKNWDWIVASTQAFVQGVIDIWNNLGNNLKALGNVIYDAITKPFRDAWNFIKGIMDKIKNKADPNHRESPSMVDRLRKGVNDLNNVWGDLSMPSDMSLSNNFAVAGMGNETTSANTSINIDLAGAVIGDMSQASRLGEMIGDSILKRVKANVRF